MANYELILVVLIAIVGTLVEDHVEACSCMPTHPQELYCTADFVITAKIKKEYVTNTTRIYKAKINKRFKVSEKANIALERSRLITALHGNMCGVQLEIGKTYLVTGRVTGLQPHIGLCGFVKPLKEVTGRQRKGFLRIYERGCDCKITKYESFPKSADKCEWNNMACQRDFGICLRSPKGRCRWAKSNDMKKCIIKSKKPIVARQVPVPRAASWPVPWATNHINYNLMPQRDVSVNTR